MKTFLVTIAVLGLFAMPLLAAEETKIDLSGRLAVGYQDNGKGGAANPGSFTVPDAKVQLNGKIAEDVTGVIRINYNNAVAGTLGADYVYISVDNLVNKMANTKSPVNPTIIVGLHKVNFGEETFTNNPVENALVSNSVANVSGQDVGIQFKQDNLCDSLPVILGVAVSLLNGCGATPDNNNAKAHVEKVSATMKNTPLYFSLSNYGSELLPAATNSGLNVTGANPPANTSWNSKVYELDVRYDLLEGAAKFDPAKAPLFSDSKGVFRLAYGNATNSCGVAGKPIIYAYVMLDGIYNIDKKWYVAFRYSYDDVTVKPNKALDGKWTRISVGGGFRITDNTALKFDYSQNTEPKPTIDNNSVNLIFSTKW